MNDKIKQKIERMSKDAVFFFGAETLTSTELKALVSELETKTRALEQLRDKLRVGWPKEFYDIAQTALRGDENE